MGKNLPKKGNKIPSSKDDVETSFITAIGTLMTGQTNIDEATKLRQQVKGKGAPKPENTGILGILTKMSNNIDVILGGQDNKSAFEGYWKDAIDNQKYLKENVLNNENKDSFFKQLPKIISNIDKNLSSVIDTMAKEEKAPKEEENLNIKVQGGTDFSKMIDSFKEFVINDENKSSIEALSDMTKKGGALNTVFEGVDDMNALNTDFDAFGKQLDKMGEATTKAVAIGDDNKTAKIKEVIETFGEIAKLILALTVLGVLLVVVGLLANYIDFKAILKFTGMLLLFLAGISLVFILAAHYMEPGSEVFSGIQNFMLMVVIAAAIMIFGAMMNQFISFKDVLGFTVKLGIFLLMLAGIFLIWNKLKPEVASALIDAVIAVGLAAFIMFLGAASFKLLSIPSLLGFLFFLGTFLFGIVIVLFATKLAMKLAGGGDSTGPLREALLLVVGAAFIMFLGAACFKYIDKGALTGFILMFDFFLSSLIAILMPLIAASDIFDKGAEVIRSVTLFVGLAAAVMIIGGGLIMYFPELLVTIPAFIALLDGFILGLGLVLTPLIAMAGIFDDGYKVMEQINKLIIIASACMCLGGLLIVWFPDLIWGIPVFITMMNLMIGSVMTMMLLVTSTLSLRKAMEAFMILEAIKRVIYGVSKAFLLLAIVAAIIDKAGGVVAFGVVVGCVISTIVAILGMMILVQKTMDIAKAQIAIEILNAVSSAVMITCIAFGILGIVYTIVQKAGGIGGFSLLVAMVVGSLIILTGAILLLATTLGNGLTTTMAYIAIGVVLAAAAAFAIVAAALLAIAVSLKVLSTIKSFDMTPLIKGVTSLLLLVGALAPLALAMPFILMASVALMALTGVISKMAEAVKEYADLKISIYEGTKHVGYRHLEKKDFEEAAKNVSLIVTTLTKGIMKAYEEHPEWYGATGLFSLIGNAMNGGQTPLERVIRQSKLLAPLICQIADAIKDYADLKIKTYKGTEHSGYRHLKKKDFKDAATNISLVLTTLTQGVMQVYEEHPEWYGAAFNLQSFFDNFLSDNSKEGTPLERVIKHAMKLGPLVSKIGEAIGDIANLKFANRWDNQGKPIGYKLMKPADFQKASDNVVKTITVLSEGVMQVYEEHPDWYGIGGTSIGSFFKSVVDGMFNNGTPMERVIAQNIKLSTLISKVAAAMKDYAQLTVPIKWNEKGEAIDFRNIKNEDFDNASHNVANVLITLANGVMSVYQEHGDWYENTGTFGTGDTPMEKVIKVDKKLAELISVVAASVKDYAELMIPIEWDKESGKAIKFREMKPEDFVNAGNNIGLVVTTAAVSLMGYYPDGSPTPYQPLIEKYMMKDEDDADEEFERLIDNSQKIAMIISGMADGISKYAKMLVPDQWDPKTGTPIHYVQMDAKMMKDAGEGIGTIITWVASSLIQVYENNKAMFGWDEEEEEFKDDSPIQHVIDSCVNMGKVVTGIADGITKFAEMKMPIEWDNTGKPIKFEKIGKQVFTDAGNNIGEILTLLGGTMMGIYEANPEMFTIRMKKEGGFLGIGESEVPAEEMTPFERVTDASVKMATVVGSIAQALQIFADKKVISKDKNGNETIVGITTETITLAKKSITDILITVAHTFKQLATGPTASLFASEAMDNIVEAVGKMMEVVGTMSTSLQNLAMLKVPIKWGENGEPTDYRQMNTGDFAQASVNIQLILGALGEAFMSIANDPRNSWITNSSQHKSELAERLGGSFSANATSSEEASDGIMMVLDGMSTLATILSVMSGCIYGYATMRFPMGTDKDGKVEYSKPLTTSQIIDAQFNIWLVASTLANAMQMVIETRAVKDLANDEDDKMNKTTTAIQGMIDSLTKIVEGVKGLTENEAMKSITKIQKSLDKMIAPLSSIITDIGDILMLLYGGDEKYGSVDVTMPLSHKEYTVKFSFADLMKRYSPMFDELSGNMDKFINSIAHIVESLATLDQPFENSYTKINSLFKLFKEEDYNTKVHTIIDSIGQLLYDMKAISNFDKVLIGDKETMYDYVESGMNIMLLSKEAIAAENREKAQKEIDSIVEKLQIYSDLIILVTNTLKRINKDISDIQMANYIQFNLSILGFFQAVALIKNSIGSTTSEEANNVMDIITTYSFALGQLIKTAAKTATLGDANFSVLANGIIEINNSLVRINFKSLTMFTLQTLQLDRFVKTVNNIKLFNLLNLNMFVNSLNKLATRMGNLDRLTDAIANKLTKVLEKLVERLLHAERTIVTADTIQQRRHDLIKQSVQEVSELMKQPMTVQIQAIGGSAETPAETPTDNNSNNASNNTPAADNKKPNDTKK